jgi:alkyl hydroperoxide reductase subunit AhpF
MKQEALSEGLRHELESVAVLNVPHGLAEHNPVAALATFQKELNKPIISVHAGVLHVNGIEIRSGTLSINQLIESLKKSASKGGSKKKTQRI